MSSKIVTLQLHVRVNSEVRPGSVAQQLNDAINPDDWNWDVGYPEVISSVPAPDDDEEDAS